MALLPLAKVLALLTRQITKPLSKRVVQQAQQHAMIDKFTIALGRFILGTSGSLKAAKPASSSPTAGGAPAGGDHVTPEFDAELAASTADRTPLPADTPPRPPGFVGPMLPRRIRDRFYGQEVSVDQLRASGAELLVEILAFTILSLLLTYEYAQTKAAERAREEMQLARLRALEEKVNELAKLRGGVRLLSIGSGELPAGGIFGRVRGMFGYGVASEGSPQPAASTPPATPSK